MDMCGVSSEKHTSDPVTGHHPDVRSVQREPGSLRKFDFHAGSALSHQLPEQLQRRLAFIARRHLRLKLELVGGRQRTKRQPAVGMIWPGVPGIPVQSAQTYVSHVHPLVLPGFALERHVKMLTDEALPAIRCHQIPAPNALLLAIAR